MKIDNLTLKYAQKYARRGWSVVPVPAKEKAPRLKDWQKLRLKKSDLADYFSGGGNVGVLLGEPSKHLLDVDLDCDQAVFLASAFLPATERIHGRKSKPRSHWYYYGQAGLKPEKFSDPEGRTCLLEIRSTGQQTIIPPSIHPSGEKLRWAAKGKPSNVTNGTILQTARKLAAGCLLARHWPSIGGRNESSMALAGLLLRAGWTVEEAEIFISNVARAAYDEEWKDRGVVARSTQERLSKNLPVTGRPRLDTLIGKQVMDLVVRWLEIQPESAESSKPSMQVNQWPKPLHKNAFCGLVGDIVRKIGPETEADPAAIIVQLIVAFGNQIGPQPYYFIEGTRQKANLFCLVVGRSAVARKGTAWAHVLRLLKRVDSAWFRRCIASNLSSGEGIIWAVRTDEERKRPIGKKRSLVPANVIDKRLLVVESEFSSALRIQRRDGNIVSPIIRQAWDSKPMRLLTKNSPAEARGAHVSIIGHITKDELRKELTATDEANGYANRFLFVASERKRRLPRGGRIAQAELDPFVRRLTKAKLHARDIGELDFNQEAGELWDKSYESLTRDVPGMLGAITARAATHVLRIAVIYAVLDLSFVIKVRHLRAALAVWRYCARSAQYIFGGSLGNKHAGRILDALRKQRNGLSRTQIRELFFRNLDAEEIERALAFLLEYKLASCRREDTNGRPKETWFAT
jgi:hypothetical protein